MLSQIWTNFKTTIKLLLYYKAGKTTIKTGKTKLVLLAEIIQTCITVLCSSQFFCTYLEHTASLEGKDYPFQRKNKIPRKVKMYSPPHWKCILEMQKHELGGGFPR